MPVQYWGLFCNYGCYPVDRTRFPNGDPELESLCAQAAGYFSDRRASRIVSAGGVRNGKPPESATTEHLLRGYYLEFEGMEPELLILVKTSVNLWQNLRDGLRMIAEQTTEFRKQTNATVEVTITVDWADRTRTMLWLHLFLLRRIFGPNRSQFKVEIIGIKFYPAKWWSPVKLSKNLEGLLGLTPWYQRMMDLGGENYRSPVHAIANQIAKQFLGHEV